MSSVNQLPTLLVSINGTARLLNLGRTKTYELIRQQDLVAIKLGRRTLVTMNSINALIAQAIDGQDLNNNSSQKLLQPTSNETQSAVSEPEMRK